ERRAGAGRRCEGTRAYGPASTPCTRRPCRAGARTANAVLCATPTAIVEDGSELPSTEAGGVIPDAVPAAAALEDTETFLDRALVDWRIALCREFDRVPGGVLHHSPAISCPCFGWRRSATSTSSPSSPRYSRIIRDGCRM